ncbi:hypothetical protein N0V84_004852 [Fusarium piperis]|uniref:Ankyrin n=1 Tax=Fusarium piperis TaxID=1435070 RepID=A0A9W8WF09_9HYPO|nr:hypothetical protein N0V84_004852 [Fusarium piperis]
MESFGLGSREDILLCMIPALSFQDLLPNRAILTLLPRVAPEHRWAETAQLYENLLDTTIRSDPPEQFCYSAVAATVNFLLVANEPCSDVWPPRGLKSELDIVTWKLKTKFRDIITQLLPIYRCQGRGDDLWSLFPEETFRKQANICHETGEALGISDDHKRIFKAIKSAKDEADRPENGDPYPIPTPIEFPKDMGKSSDIFGWKPIHYACSSESKAFWRRLPYSARLPDPEFRRALKVLNLFEQSPLHVAASMGNTTALRYLIRALEPVFGMEKEELDQALNMIDINGMTPLHWAAKSGSLGCVKLITRRQQSLTRTDIWGREALHVAIGSPRGVDDRVISQLLNTGSWSLKIDNTGWSPVHYLQNAIPNRVHETTPWENRFNDQPGTPRSDEASLDDGSESFGMGRYYDDDLSDGSECQEMAGCSEENIPDWVNAISSIVDMIDEAEPKGSADSTRQNELVVFERLALKMHDFRDENGHTFLHLAAEVTPVSTVEELIQRGYDVEARDSEGRTPLHTAIQAGNNDVAECLVDHHQADLLAKDYAKFSTLTFAIQMRFYDMIDRILDTDGDLNGQGENGGTALHYAVHIEDLECAMRLVERLVEKGCDPKIEDFEGRTALHEALAIGSDQTALYLLQPDNIHQRLEDYRDQTLLIDACYGGCHKSIPRILKQWPSIMSKVDPEFNAPPISWACASENKAAVKAFNGQ